MEQSNYIACLSVPTEKDLFDLLQAAENQSIKYSIFNEPDINEEITAIALGPGVKTKELCSKLKLALK